MQQQASKMSRKSSLIAQKAWDLLRALLWARKGEMFHKLMKKVVHFHFLHSTNESSRALLFGDHEFSFRSTPNVHVRMHRPPSALRCIRMPHISCIKPRADDEDDCFDEDDDNVMCGDHEHRGCFFRDGEGEMSESDGDQGIDKRAEEFIAKFYEEMKMQRQISCV